MKLEKTVCPYGGAGLKMEKIQLNNEMTLTYPDGFHVMGKEELKKHQYFGEPPAWSISNPERHVMISIAWKKTNGFVAKLLNTRDIVQKMEAGIRVPMQQYGYQLEGFLSLEAGGKNADGFRYSYTVQETGMSGESLCIKNKNTFYYIHCYYRTELKEESIELFEKMIREIVWN